MMRRRQRGRSRVGVDVAGRTIRAVQVVGSVARPRIDAAAAIHRHTRGSRVDESDVERLADVLERQGFAGRDIVLAVPRERVLSATLEVAPGASPGEIEQAARREIATMSGCSHDDMEIGWWALPAPARAGDGLHVMAAACTHDDAEALLDLFEAGDLFVHALDLESAALLRACAGAAVPTTGLRGVLAVDWESTHLVVVLGDVVVYQRTIPGAGLASVYAELGEQFDLDEAGVGALLAPDADETAAALPVAWTDGVTRQFAPLVKEVETSVSYVAYRYPAAELTRVTVTGDGATIPLLVRLLQDRLTVTVQPFEPPTGHAMTAAMSGGRPGELATALGLALRRT
jgi:type IV pilus assembly protein PilM